MEEMEQILNEMKEKGIGGAVIRNDGINVSSTMAMDEITTGLISSVSNVSDALMKRSGDSPQSMELTFKNRILVIVPIKNHIFCAMIDERTQKKTVLEYAKRANELL